MKKEQVLKILKKYGFYSLNRAPYLYEKDAKVGVYFVWPHVHYGILERVLFFENEEELEEEVYKYWWFLNNKDKLQLFVQFDDYEILSPKVVYKFKNIILDSEKMKKFDHEGVLENNQDSIKKKQLLRTATILIMILSEKFKIQNETYFKVLEMQESLKKVTNTYHRKLNQYNKTDEIEDESYELLMDDFDESDDLTNTLYNELSVLATIEEIRTFIKTLFDYLKNIDLSEIHLQNIYLLNRYPFEIEDMNKRISILESALTTKKKLFKGKQNISELLREVDEHSSCKKMINVNVYIENEKKRIQEKYEDCNQVDENVLGDYLLEFEKLHIEVPEQIECLKPTQMLTKEEVLASLKSKYEKLSKKEKSACHIAASFLGDCLNDLSQIPLNAECSVNDVISQLVLMNSLDSFNEAFHLLDNYLNAKLRVKYLHILKIDTFEHFIESLLNVLHTLEQIHMEFDTGFTGYYNNKSKDVMLIHLKNFNYLDQKYSYIANIMPKVSVFYSPIQIVKPLDIIENEELVLRENEFVFLLKHKIKLETKADKIAVRKYEKDKVVKKKDFIVIMDMKEKKKCTYYEDVITSIESEGDYETQ